MHVLRGATSGGAVPAISCAGKADMQDAMDVRRPAVKSPEQLARELEERLVQEALRARRWRQRRETYRVVTLLTGLLVPSLCLTLAGIIANDGFTNWIDRTGWLPLITTACGGLAAAAVAFAAGWGVARGMMAFGALFMLVVVINQARFGAFIIVVMPGLACLYIVAGALVGLLVAQEEDR